MNSDVLNCILDSYGNPEYPNCSIINRKLILDWLQEKDLNTLGALYSLLLKKNYSERIQPPLEFNDYKKFLLNYYARCLVENPVTDDIDSFLMSRYEAGWDLANWILSLQNEKSIDSYSVNLTMKEINKLLGKLYIEGSDALRNCIITAILEHIFVNKKVIVFFQDWKSHPQLKEPYELSLNFSKEL